MPWQRLEQQTSQSLGKHIITEPPCHTATVCSDEYWTRYGFPLTNSLLLDYHIKIGYTDVYNRIIPLRLRANNSYLNVSLYVCSIQKMLRVRSPLFKCVNSIKIVLSCKHCFARTTVYMYNTSLFVYLKHF